MTVKQQLLLGMSLIIALTYGISAYADDIGDEAAQAAIAKKSVRDAMVDIPAGTFTMGCEDGRDNVAGVDKCEEESAHQVSVKAFQIGKTEVTFEQWDACKACPHADDQGWGRGNRPVINVSWDDAQTYIAWLNNWLDENYRLPTEAEWEFAARAGKNSAYTWEQQTATCEDASYARSTCNLNSTKPVGSYQANAWGLVDTCGNVWEWVADCWHSNYKGRPNDSAAWVESCENADLRVLRGGSYALDADQIRIASREKYLKSSHRFTNGFRIAKGDFLP